MLTGKDPKTSVDMRLEVSAQVDSPPHALRALDLAITDAHGNRDRVKELTTKARTVLNMIEQYAEKKDPT